MKAKTARNIWNKLRKNRSSRYASNLLILMVFVALFSDFLANDKPLYCRYKGKAYFPVLRAYAVNLGWASWPRDMNRGQWKTLAYQAVVWPPVPYSASELDARNARFTGPFDRQRVSSLRFRHWLGTDQLGRDLLAGMIHGTRVAMLVGFIAMGLASVIGIALGGLAGFFGDYRLRTSPLQLTLGLLSLLPAFFYAFVARAATLEQALQEGNFLPALGLSLLLLLGIPLVFSRLGALLEKLLHLAEASKPFTLPVDMLVMRSIELINSIPTLLLILAVVAVLPHPSIFYVMIIIGLISWTGIARFVRAELLHIREQSYIEAARSLGLPERRIFLKHALPNALGPVWIAIAFGFAGAILAEATISFLGIGLAAEDVSWGSLLRSARSNVSAWWMAIFPGIAIFITVTIFNILGEQLKSK